MTDRLRTPLALALYRTMFETRETLDAAYKSYQRAFAIAMDTGVGADGMFALRREGAAYAQALHRYSEASMEWLAYVDRQHPPFNTKGAG